MAKYEILTLPDPRLKLVSQRVDCVDDNVRRLMDDLLETMYAADNGVGLAAPQVGVAKRVVVIDLAQAGEPPNPLKIANPEIISASDEEAVTEEGCLSVPDQYADVVRPLAVKVRYLDYDNKEQVLDATDFMAVCIQHEMDHLDGVLFVDHLSSLKRNMILRRLAKQKRLTADEAPSPAPVL